MKARELLLGIGVVASVCAATPARMVSIPAGTLRPLYGTETKVAAFRIDRDPISRGEYFGWKVAGERVANPRAPMTGVTWGEARAYCLARGARLPTLAEWEYVAAVDSSRFPEVVSSYMRRSPRPTAGQGAVNGFGVRGMHDLVWEWVGDPNARIVSRHEHGAHDLSCAGAAIGASDPRDYPAFLRAAFRSGLTEQSRLATLGFRCAA